MVLGIYWDISGVLTMIFGILGATFQVGLVSASRVSALRDFWPLRSYSSRLLSRGSSEAAPWAVVRLPRPAKGPSDSARQDPPHWGTQWAEHPIHKQRKGVLHDLQAISSRSADLLEHVVFLDYFLKFDGAIFWIWSSCSEAAGNIKLKYIIDFCMSRIYKRALHKPDFAPQLVCSTGCFWC